MKEITFYYDVVCPFAYVASRLIERLAEKNAASIRWTPVLLGELIFMAIDLGFISIRYVVIYNMQSYNILLIVIHNQAAQGLRQP